jgi:hypothetical protein
MSIPEWLCYIVGRDLRLDLSNLSKCWDLSVLSCRTCVKMKHLLAQHHIACLLQVLLCTLLGEYSTTVHILYSIFFFFFIAILKLPDVLNLIFIIFHKDLPHSTFTDNAIQALLPHLLQSVRCNKGKPSLEE